MDDERNLFNENSSYDNKEYNSNENGINFVIPSPEEPKKKKRKKNLFFRYVAVALVAALIGGLAGGYGGYMAASKLSPESSVTSALTAQDVNINLTDDVYFAVAVAEKAQKTVVGITTDVVKQYDTFFGPQTQKGQSMGSGFIVDSNGYIVTNSHVIGDGEYESITVSLIDGTTEVGEVLWYDTALDLAVVKINRTGLPTVDLGDSEVLKIGEPVVAIGNPMTLDLERTVTQGIVSGLDRSIQFENGIVIEPLIQTDASINSGNSGGPLFNAEGEVVGINTAKMSTAEGLGFSIPINIAKPIVEQIIKDGKLSAVYIGITGVDVETYETALGIDVSADYGVVVIETMGNSPASEAGIESGDVITAIDGDKIESMSDLKRNLYEYKENDKTEITLIRNGQEQKVTMTLKEKPENFNN
ncbi:MULTISPECIES: S1C family serine protease [unclassified Sedimentibacter]|uniref:S1C family serine protease n=1 Tax=unclassified Sedimentibacter TaxID=2649220 RepID=UPI0027DFB3E5|nr:trypsin-like peptidase domain-containing protein [Sedimentibacter sp. MB35-C1]WMJ78028.1 trypsin-like peptidase domain-containing protein [Sedimentibacter sp. MB35-C1]